MRESGTYFLSKAFEAYKRAQAIANAPKPIPHSQWDKMMLFLKHATQFAEQAEEREPLAEITEGPKKYDAKELQAEIVLFEGKTLIQEGMPHENIRSGIRALSRYLHVREDIEVRKLIAKAYLSVHDQDAAREELRNIKRLHKDDLDLIDIEDDLIRNPTMGKPYSTTEDIAGPVPTWYHITQKTLDRVALVMLFGLGVQIALFVLFYVLMPPRDFWHYEVLYLFAALAGVLPIIFFFIALHFD